MRGKVDDGDFGTLEPAGSRELHVGDIVLAKVHGREYQHLIKATQGGRLLIGNNRGGVNGWVGAHAIYGVATKVAASDR
ncbi:MAG: hypothetical protein ACHQ7M_11600 [Chloroflexota bacterium]